MMPKAKKIKNARKNISANFLVKGVLHKKVVVNMRFLIIYFSAL
jgi:hypothetical protein